MGPQMGRSATGCVLAVSVGDFSRLNGFRESAAAAVGLVEHLRGVMANLCRTAALPGKNDGEMEPH